MRGRPWRFFYLMALMLYLAIGLGMLWTMWSAVGTGASIVSVGHSIFYSLLPLQVVSVCLLAPLPVLHSFLSYRDPECFLTISRSPRTTLALLIGSFSWPTLFLVCAVFCSALPSALLILVAGHPGWGQLFTAQFSLFFAAVPILGAATCFALSGRRVYTSAAWTYAVILLMILSVFVAPVLIANTPMPDTAVIQGSLLINPLVAVCSTVGFDLMRTDLVYRYTPIAQRQFEYPTVRQTLLIHSLATLLLVITATWRLGALRRDFALSARE